MQEVLIALILLPNFQVKYWELILKQLDLFFFINDLLVKRAFLNHQFIIAQL